MQLALRPAASCPEPQMALAHTAPRPNKLLLASVAMVGAGAMAVTPVAPSVSDIQQRAYEMTADANPILANPVAVWEDNFANAFTNFEALAASLTDQPFPILSQIIENLSTYADTIIGAPAPADAPPRQRGTGILGAIQGIERTGTLFETRLAAAQEYLASGDITAAWAEIESALLIGYENIGIPLLAPLSIPGDMLQNAADVWDSLFTRGNAVAITRGLLAPPITLSFALANIAETVSKAVENGDYEAALTALVNAPGIATGAFLNGYRPVLTYDEDGNPLTYATEAFQGVFSPLGTIDQFLVRLPRAIAAALAPPVTASTASTAKVVTLDLPAGEEATEPALAAIEAADSATAGKAGLVNVEVVADEKVPAAEAPVTAGDVVLEEGAEVAPAKDVKDVRDPFKAVSDQVAAAVKNAQDGFKNAVTGGRHASNKEATKSESDSTPKHAKDSESDSEKADSKTDAKADSKADPKSDATSDSGSSAKSGAAE
ncbi:hypothetical protein [Mycolicibacterium litorale]|uniref:PE-PGRS family protein n=1 Tax=Mycolicibacterium litorale TaxID=758802 RepID=A0AAD1MSH5_9MYCO|nr:hypothetical protein [Mycolicibacterium litorale]MCV7414574.1 hypothetical protein [Mycolicibacterium litorale]TDY03425.1 hypothetical protein BCL50_4498 [Mycolicibacterium litorale]BBY15223.1 hypothetical protein MLIT_08150 [Mycolicibacterium litorale]